jgi:CheY-like chemotaxis protein
VTSLPRVLVVEDDAAIRNMLTVALGREPLVVDGAPDGVGALEQLAAETYAVIVVDLMMPRMDGYAFLEAFRALALPQRPIVFVMTAYDDAALLKLDATVVHGSFKKPFDLDHVVTLVRDAAHALHGAGQRPSIAADAPLPDGVARDVC